MHRGRFKGEEEEGAFVAVAVADVIPNSEREMKSFFMRSSSKNLSDGESAEESANMSDGDQQESNDAAVSRQFSFEGRGENDF